MNTFTMITLCTISQSHSSFFMSSIRFTLSCMSSIFVLNNFWHLRYKLGSDVHFHSIKPVSYSSLLRVVITFTFVFQCVYCRWQAFRMSLVHLLQLQLTLPVPIQAQQRQSVVSIRAVYEKLSNCILHIEYKIRKPRSKYRLWLPGKVVLLMSQN